MATQWGKNRHQVSPVLRSLKNFTANIHHDLHDYRFFTIPDDFSSQRGEYSGSLFSVFSSHYKTDKIKQMWSFSSDHDDPRTTILQLNHGHSTPFPAASHSNRPSSERGKRWNSRSRSSTGAVCVGHSPIK